MKSYDHKEIEKKWQDAWDASGIYKVSDAVPGKENYYLLTEFTYPSGNLHVGHWYSFAVPDIFARYKRMQGFNVLYPTGFDAFGLPAENAAIKLGSDPKVWTYEQMDRMRTQLRSMGAMYDWSREVVTCDPTYYKWTQWMFNQFLKNDLAYRAVTKVNWCPNDQTILANEQVTDGKCERCGGEVIQRDQPQWMLRITNFADALVDDLEDLNWPHAIKESQRNWIGRSEGSEIAFNLSTGEQISVFTTRADTLFGVTYVVLAPEHKLVSSLLNQVENRSEVEAYITETKKKSELDRQQSKEKTGVELKGIKAINPANGEEVPVWIADYVLAGYGTGAVMAVPAHDERDFEYAKKYDLPIRTVINPVFVRNDVIGKTDFKIKHKIVSIVEDPEGNILSVNWGPELGGRLFLGGTIEEGEKPEETALRELKEETGYTDATVLTVADETFDYKYFATSKNSAFQAFTRFVHIKLNSLERSEQSLEEDEKNKFKIEWVSKAQANTEVTEVLHRYAFDKFVNGKTFTDYGTLANSGSFDGMTSQEAKKAITESVGGKLVKTYRLRDWGISRQRYWGCPIPIVYDPDGNAHPVPDEHLPWILPTDVDHTPDGTAPLARSKELLERTEKIFGAGWKPEVETMDTFVDSSWYFYRYLDNKNDAEFASQIRRDAWMPIDLYMGGAEHTTMHLLYSRFWVKALQSLGLVSEGESYTIRRNRGLILGPDGNKMSKSKGNVINPDEIVERLGTDTVRLYLAFMGPYGVTANFPWDPNGVVGVRRFLERVWKLREKVGETDTATPELHKAIKKIGEDMEEYKFNTAIAQMMILINAWEKSEKVSASEYKTLLQLLAPFAPHAAEELWHELGESDSIHNTAWPVANESFLQNSHVTMGVQVNGKTRAEAVLPIDASEEDAKAIVMALPEIQKWTEGKEVKKFVYVPGRIVNVVVG